MVLSADRGQLVVGGVHGSSGQKNRDGDETMHCMVLFLLWFCVAVYLSEYEYSGWRRDGVTESVLVIGHGRSRIGGRGLLHPGV